MKVRGTVIQRKSRSGWWVRIIYIDPETEKRRDLLRRAETRSEAIDLRDKLIRDITKSQARSVDHERKTFSDLCEHYLAEYAHPPTYRNGKKDTGMRSYRDARRHVNTLSLYFGNRPLRSITYPDLAKFRQSRLDAPVVLRHAGAKIPETGARRIEDKTLVHRQRNPATVNRELAQLRRMFKIALQLGWVDESPFNRGDSLIKMKLETERKRILSPDEERRLLAACDTPVRQHLRAYLILLLDTGARTGEALRLQWKSVDFDSGTLTLHATKTESTREIRMTTRLYEALKARHAALCPSKGETVFGITAGMQTSFGTACRIAKISDLRFHDLRHTFGTRLAQSDMNVAEIGRLLGHSQISSVTYRYINLTEKTRERAAEALNKMHGDLPGEETQTTEVN